MPEINPLTNNQIFLKKIAENTGSDYETGDISDINPLTIDQIFLKEIAANTAGQSGDISELEGKVADNTSAIEAVVNENGCCNILLNNLTTKDFGGATLTVNADKSITIDGTPNVNNPQVALCDDYTLKAGTYTLSTGLATNSELYMYIYDVTHETAIGITYQEEGGKATFTLSSDSVVRPLLAIFGQSTISNETVYPMLYDARLKPTGYVQYSMTNKQLTDAVNRGSVSVVADGVKTYKQLFTELFSLATYSKISANIMTAKLYADGGVLPLIYRESGDSGFKFGTSELYQNNPSIAYIRLHDTDSRYESYYEGSNHDLSNAVAISGRIYTLYF